MKSTAFDNLQRREQSKSAMTLIEMIGVLAVIAVLAGMLLPAAIRFLDRLASERETASLKTLGDALQGGIKRTRIIPDQNLWASWVATEAGLDVGSVTSNLRKNARVFLIDPSGWFSMNLNASSYTQTIAGATSFPANARVMLVSTLAGGNFPMASGMPTASKFADLWNAPDGTVPGSAGWAGKPEDVKIYRVNLTPLFVNLVLTTYNSPLTGLYTVEGSATNQAPFAFGVSGYFLRGTTLRLYQNQTYALQHSQILNADSSFVYEQDQWKNSLEGDPLPGTTDITDIVAAFLAAPGNTNAANPATNFQQLLIVTNMITYMSNYWYWASNGFTASLKTKLDLTGKQAAMMSAVQGLYYLANAPPQNQACP